MADNVTLPGAGAVIATENDTINSVSVEVQQIKVGWGPRGTFNFTDTPTPMPIQPYVGTAGGWTPSTVVAAASTNATSLKGSAGSIGSIQVFNNSANIGYLKIFNKASAPTVGTDTPVLNIMIPANAAGAGAVVSFGDAGVDFSTGIAFAITGGIALLDNTAVAASAMIVNINYK